MNRSTAIQQLAQHLLNQCGTTTCIVGIDGVDGSGKSYLANELAASLRSDRPTFSVSIDGYHCDRDMRYKRGRSSAAGFYKDSYDYDAFQRHVIKPLRNADSPNFLPVYFDLHANAKANYTPVYVPLSSIVIVDGIFLQRQELNDCFDVIIFVKASFNRTLSRMLARDAETTNDDQETIAMFNTRYRPGQEMYLRECTPESRASVVFDNNDLDSPTLCYNGANKQIQADGFAAADL